MSDICVVHLVRQKNGIAPFKNFLSSYIANPGGIEHDLLIIFKGFINREDALPYQQLIDTIVHKEFFIDDAGFDINAYFAAVNNYNYKYYCFLNSFSSLLDHDWLLKLFSNLIKQNVGIVGASGSYESIYTNFITGFTSDINTNLNIIGRFELLIQLIKYRYYFDPFPNYHIRTNGFMISSDVMREIRCDILMNKMDAHRFESGKQSLTKQIFQMNLNALIVGKDGQSYEKQDWHRAGTFRQGDQSNLLIADNQTNAYSLADSLQREKLILCAWGTKSK